MWFRNSYRRHLLDMHINDWEDGYFLSEFSPDAYYENLKRANVKSAMIYLQSHVGYCYYPTKVGHVHTAFKERPYAMRDLINKCRENGIDVVGYYSINDNSLEEQLHPEWSAKKEIEEQQHGFSGKRYGHCCPNNPDYMAFVKAQIKEMIEYAEMDGLFFDMPFWASPCYCEHCQRKWRDAVGGTIPSGREDSRWLTFLQEREKWTEAYIGDITAYVKSLRPQMSVEYNYAYAALNALEFIGSEGINKHNDYAAGDIYKTFLVQSFACKFYHAVTKNRPFEYMTGRCDPSLQCHTVTKAPDKLRLAMMLTVAHHGANFVIDAIDPVGTMDSRVYDRIGQLYREVELYEPYLSRGELVEDVGVLYSLESRSYNDRSEGCHYEATVNTAKTLIQSHIPFGFFTQATCDNLDRYKAVMVANPVRLTPETVEKLAAYAEQGGVLYFSGGKQTDLIEKLLGGTVSGFAQNGNGYLAPLPAYTELMGGYNAKYPLPFQVNLPLVEGVDPAHVAATITLPYQSEKYGFSSIHSNPPGVATDYPGVVVKPYGKGTVIWAAGGIESRKPQDYKTILLNLLAHAGVRDYTVRSTGSVNTELVAFRSDTEILLSAVYLTDNDVTDIQRPFTISVACDRKPRQVTLLPGGADIPFTYEDGYATFTTEELNVFDMYRIEL